MILSDIEIKEAIAKGEIEISGFEPLHIGSSSVDLHLANSSKTLKMGRTIDISKEISNDMFEINLGWSSFILMPDEFYIMSTIEKIRFAPDIVGFVQGRSSLARIGIQVHCAGFVDSGFEGTITLEVTNLTPRLISIPKKTRICQMVFARTGKPSEIPYNLQKQSKYQGQSGATLTKIYKDFV